MSQFIYGCLSDRFIPDRYVALVAHGVSVSLIEFSKEGFNVIPQRSVLEAKAAAQIMTNNAAYSDMMLQPVSAAAEMCAMLKKIMKPTLRKYINRAVAQVLADEGEKSREDSRFDAEKYDVFLESLHVAKLKEDEPQTKDLHPKWGMF